MCSWRCSPCYCQTVCGPFTSGVRGGGHRLHRWPEFVCLIDVCMRLELFQVGRCESGQLQVFKLSQAFVVYFTLMSLPYALVLVWTLIPGIFWMWVLIPGMIVCLSISPYLLRLGTSKHFHVLFEKMTVKVASFQDISGILVPLDLFLATWSFSLFSMVFPQDFRSFFVICCAGSQPWSSSMIQRRWKRWPIWWWSPERGRFRYRYFRDPIVPESSLWGQFSDFEGNTGWWMVNYHHSPKYSGIARRFWALPRIPDSLLVEWQIFLVLVFSMGEKIRNNSDCIVESPQIRSVTHW